MTRHHMGMRAVILQDHGGPDHLVAGKLSDPEPLPGEVVVDLVAAALNHRDVWQRTAPGNHGAVLGSDGAGVVSQLGESVTGVEIGQEVVMNPRGGWGGREDGAAPGRAMLRA